MSPGINAAVSALREAALNELRAHLQGQGVGEDGRQPQVMMVLPRQACQKDQSKEGVKAGPSPRVLLPPPKLPSE